MKINTKIAYTDGEDSTTLYTKNGAFFSHDVIMYAEGDIEGTIEVYFRDGTSTLIYHDYRDFASKITGPGLCIN